MILDKSFRSSPPMTSTSDNSSWNGSASTGHCATRGQRAGTNNNDPLPQFTLWDAANVFEFATSRFAAIRRALGKSYMKHTPKVNQMLGRHIIWEAQIFVLPFVNICMGANMQPTLPFLLVQIVGLMGRQQVGLYHDEDIADAFLACPAEKYPCLWEGHQLTPGVQLNLTEVMAFVNEHFEQQPEGALLAALPTTMNPQGGPLSRQLLVVRAAAARATDEVRQLIEDKQIEAELGAKSLGCQEDLNIGHAMEASRCLVYCARQLVTTP
ncbi:uncharacterized protein F5891DRAFT_1193219 [Suillus fuscotomentosus]|uniref:Uncharacterized protein n=1 Tax=Suillus fuscotomentosus TaxID=1912939 RepID=A0AAD4E0V0_9AGAM|nr:uncharacterized protein F5891DRAFT_1193219 [Suillus fuscotomentosus]KAG1896404.1 hypothetical protein F5891DRAFT_1193219 [Suillus fuscotomentosus]